MNDPQLTLFPEQKIIKNIECVDITKIETYDTMRLNKLTDLPPNTFFIYKTGGVNSFIPELGNVFPYVKNHINNKIYLPQLNKTYLQVVIKHEGKGYQVALGRVACAAFVYNDNPELKKMVDHINGNRIDDRIENLQWQSQSNNLKKKKMGKGYFEQRVKY
jgi:hypothetical protein